MRFSGPKSPWSRNRSKSNSPPVSLLLRAVTGKRKTLQIAWISRFEAHRRQNKPGKENLRLLRDLLGYFEPFGNLYTFPIKLNIGGHTNTMCGLPVERAGQVN